MRKYLMMMFFVVAMLTVPSFAQTSTSCGEKDVSRKVKNQTSKWEKTSRNYGHADQVLEKIEKALASKSYSACELERVEATQRQVSARSEISAKSIPALEHFIETTDRESNAEWSTQIERLSFDYRRTAQFDKLGQLSLDNLGSLEEDESQVLEDSLLLAKIGQGEFDSAFAQLVEKINTSPQRLTLWDLRYGYALAQRLGRTDDADALKTVADTNFMGLRMPDPLPAFEGDDLEHLLARETDDRYFVTVVSPPFPQYPSRAAESGIQGSCDVYLDITTKGLPENVEPICSHQIFETASRRAVKKMRFEPLIIDGVAHPMPDFAYPLEYSLR